MRGIDNMNKYLAMDKNNVGVQIHLSTSKLGLPSSVIDSWGRMSVGMYNFNSIPVRSCRRNDKTLDNVNPEDSFFCAYDNKYTFYSVGGKVFNKINDSTFDVISFFKSEKSATNVNYALSLIVVEDSIYDDQKDIDGTIKKVYHRNIMRGYKEIPSGVMPTSIIAGKTYLFMNRIKVKVAADVNKLRVVVVAMNMANNTYLNAGTDGDMLVSEIPQICMTTSDSLNHNNIIWQPLSSKGKIYIEKETNITNKYVVIDSVASGKPRLYTDLNSNSAIKPEAYRLIFKDTTQYLKALNLGNSTSSSPHRPIHLSINKGSGNSWNLLWSQYQGFSVVSYNVFRKVGTGPWQKISSVSGNVFSYTDFSSFTNVAYKITVVAPSACDPNAWSINESESNVADQDYLKNTILSQQDLNISPNPAMDEVNIVSSIKAGTIKGFIILDVLGRIVLNEAANGLKHSVSLKGLQPGNYTLMVKFNNGVLQKKLIKM